MALDQKLVVHFRDGIVMKGTSLNFSPNRDSFHFTVIASPTSHHEPVEVNFSQLKAVFFVKDFTGNKDYQGVKDFSNAPKSPHGRKAMVRCKDGETLYGFIQGYASDRPGFFIFPVDPKENNVKIFILQSFVSSLDFPE